MQFRIFYLFLHHHHSPVLGPSISFCFLSFFLILCSSFGLTILSKFIGKLSLWEIRVYLQDFCIAQANCVCTPTREISSVQFSRLVMSDSLRPHELQHARPPCPSRAPRVHPNPCPSSWWCHPTISSSVIPFSSCPQSFPASGSFQMTQFFPSGGQSIGVSASTSVLQVKTQD